MNGDLVVGITGTNRTTNLTAPAAGHSTSTAPGRNRDRQQQPEQTENRSTVDLSGLGLYRRCDQLPGRLAQSVEPRLRRQDRSNLLLSNAANTITAEPRHRRQLGHEQRQPRRVELGAGNTYPRRHRFDRVSAKATARSASPRGHHRLRHDPRHGWHQSRRISPSAEHRHGHGRQATWAHSTLAGTTPMWWRTL